MTVNADDTADRFAINGIGPYGFSFKIFSETDLAVVAIDEDGAAATLSEGAHYTVSGAGENDGGSVTLTSGAATTYDGYTIDIRSNVPAQQPTPFGSQGTLRLSAIETALDRATRQIQDLNRKLLLCLRIPDNEDFPTTEFPSAGLREGTFWTFDAAGNLETGTPIDEPLTSSLIGTTLDSLKRTQAEIDEGVTPVNYAYPPLNVRRYGTTWDAIQTAIDVADRAGGGTVYLPAGQYTKGTANTINMSSNVRIVGDGFKSEIFVPDSASFTDNILKFESITKAGAANIRINGNRANTASGTRYGFYFGGSTECTLTSVYAHGCEGDGIHAYDCDGCVITQCHSYDNLYHGIELEQCRDSIASSNNCYENLLHGIYVFEGEVGAEGSQGLTISANSCHDNTQYGIGVQGALTEDISVQGNTIRNNGQYGITLFGQVKGAVVTGNLIAGNGYTGIYVYRTQRSLIVGNLLHDNSQAGDGDYQEIHLDSEVGDNGTLVSRYNVIVGNMIRMEGLVRADYGIKENGINDGPNIVQGNYVAGPGRSGNIAVLQETGVGNSMQLCRGNIGRSSENRGTETFNGNGSTTAFNIPHGLFPDEPRSVLVTPGSPNASGAFSVASDATNITVTFAVAPISGTGNVILRWFATT